MTRVLIVDDKPENLYLLRVLLQGHGCAVDEARHGAEALVKARQTQPDLIVSDLLMPVMDGYTLLRQWKADAGLKAIPFVVYTATYTDPKDERLALEMGADAFIVKPAEPQPFMARIRDVLERARRDELSPPRSPQAEDEVLLAGYSQALVRKLEDKAAQLERANLELRESEERLHLAAGAANIGLWDWDVRTNRVHYSREWKRQLGYEEHEISDDFESWRSRCHPDDVARVIDTMNRYMAKPWPNYELESRLRHKDGSYREILTRAELQQGPDGKAWRMFGCNIDITERNLAQAALRDSEERLRLFVRHAPAAIAMFDTQMRYLAVSDRWLSDYRLERGDLVGRSHYDVFPEIPESWRRVHERVLAGATERADEDPFERPDGSLDWVRWEMIPWRTAEGAVGGALLFTEVITERKQAEEALRSSQSLAVLGTVVAGVAHEVRNPLFAMSSTLDALEERFADEAPRYVSVLRVELERLNALARDLLDYGRPPQLELLHVEFGEVLSAATGDCAALARDRGVRLVEPIASELPITADHGRLRQVLINLIDNAVRHAPAQGLVTIAARLVNDAAAPAIECRVEDDGPGFTAETLAHVFEPFFSRRKGGTGLGLAIAQRLVEMHGGTIAAGNRPEGGAVVTLRLPVAGPKAAP